MRGLKPEHKLEGHLAMRGRDYKGPGQRAMQCAHKTPIASAQSSDDVQRDVRRAMYGLVASLPAQLRNEVTPEMIQEGTRAGSLQPGDRQTGRATTSHLDPTMADVAALREAFEGLIVSEIDKARGELAVL